MLIVFVIVFWTMTILYDLYLADYIYYNVSILDNVLILVLIFSVLSLAISIPLAQNVPFVKKLFFNNMTWLDVMAHRYLYFIAAANIICFLGLATLLNDMYNATISDPGWIRQCSYFKDFILNLPANIHTVYLFTAIYLLILGLTGIKKYQNIWNELHASTFLTLIPAYINFYLFLVLHGRFISYTTNLPYPNK